MGNFSQTGVSPDGVVVGVWFLSVTYLLMLWLWRKSAIKASRWLQPQVGMIITMAIIPADSALYRAENATVMAVSPVSATTPTSGHPRRIAHRTPGFGALSPTVIVEYLGGTITSTWECLTDA